MYTHIKKDATLVNRANLIAQPVLVNVRDVLLIERYNAGLGVVEAEE
jgi:hypothetical protein